MKRVLLLLLMLNTVVNAQNVSNRLLPEYLQVQPAVFSLTLVMMHDVVNPPAASRYYTYCMLGAYEIVSQQNSSLPALSRLIKNYPGVSISVAKPLYNYRIAALYSILETGRILLPSGYQLKEQEDKFVQTLVKQKIPASVIEQSVLVARQVSAAIVAYSGKDHYSQLSAKVRYSPVQGDEYWYPTPPTYIEAVEPHWKSIRTMIMDSCNEFIPAPPIVFSKDTASAFYRLAREVYDVSRHLTAEQLNVASFWDCNPFAITTSGHMAIGFKKISPGGHWMNIAGIAAAQANLNFDRTVLVHTFEAITLMDAFISCWDEKYRSNRIRPETYINRYIDVRWQPLLQTPPFPEYSSGHSVISTASAEILTYLFGDGFTYVDNSEVLFDISPRNFHSFREAAAEASISRLYGGIHFRDAITNGQEEGRKIGDKVIHKIRDAGILPVYKPGKQVAKNP